jgi:5-methylcytosine-specific restriction endonuclease McrA
MPTGIVGSKKTYRCLYCNEENYFKHGNANLYCSKKCQKDEEHRIFIEQWKSGSITGDVIYGISRHIRRYIEEKFENKCTGCGISDWRGLPLSLTLEHIDGNGLNSKEENLTLLCPNCHSQTPTFAGRNKGKGTRSYRRKYDEIYLESARQTTSL